tara:strand:+ start:652 stop:819 length:168 start_codon:yes stop_codon:yes gene_type:complete
MCFTRKKHIQKKLYKKKYKIYPDNYVPVLYEKKNAEKIQEKTQENLSTTNTNIHS